MIKNRNWEQIAAMRVDGKIRSFQEIKPGVRQRCVLSPVLFSLYSEMVMRNLERYPGINVGEGGGGGGGGGWGGGGHNAYSLRYAVDTVLTAENKEDLQ